jgi:hypothetical protein
LAVTEWLVRRIEAGRAGRYGRSVPRLLTADGRCHDMRHKSTPAPIPNDRWAREMDGSHTTEHRPAVPGPRPLDEIRVELTPVILGSGIPFFANLKTTPVLLDDPTVIEGDRVTHLVYTVRK